MPQKKGEPLVQSNRDEHPRETTWNSWPLKGVVGPTAA
jgi:hypothetical protein